MDIPNEFHIGSVKSLAPIKGKGNEISTDDFLQIMAATMKMPPMPGGSEGGGGGGETDQLTQLATFNMLDQLTKISEKMNSGLLINQQQQAFNLMGKEVKVLDGEGFATGIVEKVRFDKGYATIQVNGKNFYLNDIIEASNKA
ncbi:flagellar basal-body rod modification protein FlgD [Carnobacterium iners]|uniref:Flagellar basal-body rod modification protein FlgD n=1 Tax=Carnobacterium iners TaxID=1073423 RepID=A0A1X7N0M5_9LACT|nr:flagellar hook assembly protein [Carnobacterium iners]SEK21956.1 flagellar basal-body rod modification protein FlgD [Carnobacterium iners]SMH30786.1 flagellar basal-body rod modification protein FlgD [Carnobacterium iners]